MHLTISLRRCTRERPVTHRIDVNRAIEEMPMSVEANKAAVRRLLDEVYNRQNFAVAGDILAADSVHHGSGDWSPDMHGPDASTQAAAAWKGAFPDFHVDLDALVGKGEEVAYRWTATGTQQGAFMSIPATGKRMRVTGQVLMRFAGGKIVEGWTNMDDLGLREQLGADRSA
jgi:predicted ester cyclase